MERTGIDDTAALFERNLEPLLPIIAASTQEHVMDKLSLSLKKALFLMAMERFGRDPRAISRALGISRAKLEKELERCGLRRERRAAA